MRRHLSVHRALVALVGAGVLVAVPAMTGEAAAAPQSPGQGQAQGQGRARASTTGVWASRIESFSRRRASRATAP